MTPLSSTTRQGWTSGSDGLCHIGARCAPAHDRRPHQRRPQDTAVRNGMTMLGGRVAHAPEVPHGLEPTGQYRAMGTLEVHAGHRPLQWLLRHVAATDAAGRVDEPQM